LHGRADQRFADDSCRMRYARSQPVGVAHELRQLIGAMSLGAESLDVAAFGARLAEQATVTRYAQASGKSPVEAQVLLLKRRFADTDRLRQFGFTDGVLAAALISLPSAACRWCFARASLDEHPVSLKPHFMVLLGNPCLDCATALRPPTPRKAAPRRPATATRRGVAASARRADVPVMPPAGNLPHGQECGLCADARRRVAQLPNADSVGIALIASARQTHLLVRRP
jgi:hypothetical protein